MVVPSVNAPAISGSEAALPEYLSDGTVFKTAVLLAIFEVVVHYLYTSIYKETNFGEELARVGYEKYCSLKAAVTNWKFESRDELGCSLNGAGSWMLLSVLVNSACAYFFKSKLKPLGSEAALLYSLGVPIAAMAVKVISYKAFSPASSD